MKKAMTLALVFTVLFGALALVSYATSVKGHSEEGYAACSRYHEAMKDVKVEVTNIANGVVVKATSDKPEVAKLIQEHWAKCQEDHGEGNPGHAHKEGSGECKEAHESGKCKGHGSGKHGHAEGSEECKKAHESGKCTGHEPGTAHPH